MRQITIEAQSWPLSKAFTISRGSRTHAELVYVEIQEGQYIGRGECTPYPRYGESIELVLAQLNEVKDSIEQGIDNAAVQALPICAAAKNALDCALWDLKAHQTGKPINKLLDIPAPLSSLTTYTIGIDSLEHMVEDAKAHADYPFLKLKVGSADALPIIQAIDKACPNQLIIIDANESWKLSEFEALLPTLEQLNILFIEQPLHAENDVGLDRVYPAFPICADESCHNRASLPTLKGKYDIINIKLDKTGGITEALDLIKEAKAQGFKIMIGCMLGTSLAMDQAWCLTGLADYIDLDGNLYLLEDRKQSS